MGTFDEALWTRLVDEHQADRVVLSSRPPRHRPRAAIITAGTAATAVTLSAVLALSATTSTPSAYALTANPDGSVTITIHDLTAAIPALNAKFAEMGIDETVIPIQAGCSTRGLVNYPGATMSEPLTFTPGHKNLPPGWDGVLAAEQLPNGKVALTIGSRKPPLPSCFSNIPWGPTELPNEPASAHNNPTLGAPAQPADSPSQ
jgi:hypothetical protein